MIELHGISKSYPMGDHTVHALRGVSLSIDDGDFVAIMGPSGSGKSTLMHILGLLDVADEGVYTLTGREVKKLAEDDLAVFRREEIGFIFQQFNLLPRMSALENVALPFLYSERKMDLNRAGELLDKVGLASRALHHPNELSGGQQQRVAIARSLANRPKLILADEPTGNLDSASEKEIIGALRDLNSLGITVIVVTHEEEIARQTKRLIKMRDGVVLSDERLEPYVLPPPVQSTTRVGNNSLLSRLNARFLEVWSHFDQGMKTLAANKIRTALSMLGILIGVAAVISMLALGNGAQQAIESQLSSLGSNILTLYAGGVRIAGVAQQAGSVTRLALEDAMVLKEQVPHLIDAAPGVNGRGQITFGGNNWNTQILGGSAAYSRMHSAKPEVGRFFSEKENLQRARVAVIGATLVRELFAGKNPVGEMIKINRVNFQVIGVLPEKGGSGWHDADDIIVVPVFTAMHRLLGKNHLDVIELQIDNAANVEEAQDTVLKTMFARHRVPLSLQDEAYKVFNMTDIRAALTASSQTMALLLASIAAISLLVGGIGIMNIMLVSVTERTREIGLRKAIGARRGDILSQFLIEAVAVSAVGGLCGIALGWGITSGLGALAGWTTSISAGSVFLAFFFSAGIGVVFGIYPARKASRLNPIDALRYE